MVVLKLLGCRCGADQSPTYQLPLGLAMGFGRINSAVETTLALWLKAHS